MCVCDILRFIFHYSPSKLHFDQQNIVVNDLKFPR